MVRGYVLFRPMYRPNITLAKTIPFIVLFLVLVGGIVYLKGWKIGLLSGGAILLLFSRFILIKLIELYQHYAPEEVRRKCMLKPTCSEYAIIAIRKYGPFYGMFKTIMRLFFVCRGDIYHIDNP